MSVELRGRIAAILVGVALMLPGVANAGPLFSSKKADCPKPSYSQFHYWTPGLYRDVAWICGPKVDLYAPDRAPGMPARSEVIRYACPAVDPATLYQDRPVVP